MCCAASAWAALINDEGRLKYSEDLYLKSPAEMAQNLASFDQAMENTVRIAQMCNLELDFSKRHAPVYRVPADKLRPRATGILPVSSDARSWAGCPWHGRQMRG